MKCKLATTGNCGTEACGKWQETKLRQLQKGRRSAAIIGGCCRNIELHPRVGNAYATCGICFGCGDAEAATAAAAIAAHVADATVDAAAGCRRLKPRPHNYRYRCTSCTRCTRDAFSTLSSLRQIRCVVYGPSLSRFALPGLPCTRSLADCMLRLFACHKCLAANRRPPSSSSLSRQTL